MTVPQAVVLSAYLSLLYELLFLHVPSVASTVRILSPHPDILANYSPRYRRLLAAHPVVKLPLFVLPIGIIFALFAFPLFTLWSGGNPLNDDVFSATTAAQAMGIALILLGRGVTLSSVVTIRSATASGQTGESLWTTGLFRWSRNPGLVGMYAFVIGLWCLTPSALMAAGIVVYIGHMHLKILMEEDFLVNRFGRAYVEYRNSTGRYLA